MAHGIDIEEPDSDDLGRWKQYAWDLQHAYFAEKQDRKDWANKAAALVDAADKVLDSKSEMNDMAFLAKALKDAGGIDHTDRFLYRDDLP